MIKGTKLTEEHKKKISNALKGRMPKFIPDNRGLVRSEELKKRISESMKGKFKGTKRPWGAAARWKNHVTIRTAKGKYVTKKRTYREMYYTSDGQEKTLMVKRRFALKRYKVRKRLAAGSHTFEEWESLRRQYNYTCPRCGVQEPYIKLTEDHIIPLSAGGSDYINNIQPLCRACNTSKFVSVIKFEPKVIYAE